MEKTAALVDPAEAQNQHATFSKPFRLAGVGDQLNGDRLVVQRCGIRRPRVYLLLVRCVILLAFHDGVFAIFAESKPSQFGVRHLPGGIDETFN